MIDVKYAFGSRSQRELRLNYYCLCMPMIRTQWRVWMGSRFFIAEAFSSVTDRSDPMQRDAYARSTKYALMNSCAVCFFSIKMREIRLF